MSRRTKISTCFAVLFGLHLVFTNCSQGGFQAYKFHEGEASFPSLSPPTDGRVGPEYATADMSGNIEAFQDLRFRFKVSGAQSGLTITATGLPPWLTIDNANGELVGIPPGPQVIDNLSLSVNGVNSGPYKITVIGDPIKQHQWHLKNSGQTAFAGRAGTAGHDIHLENTIADRILGQDIRIAVSDTGVLETHRGLAQNILPNASRNYTLNRAQNPNWIGNSSPAQTNAENAHGTAVAGVIAERGWISIGGRGIAPLAKIAGFLFLQAQEALAVSGLLTAALYDQFQGDFDIFNYSWGDIQCGLSEYPNALRDRLRLSSESLRNGRGAIMVKASGNEFIGLLSDCYANQPANAYFLGNANFSEEGSSPHVILVGALNADGLSSSYSSPGANLWVTAPGGEYGWKSSTSNNAAQIKPAIITTDFPGSNRGLKSFSTTRNDFDAGQAPNTDREHTATFTGTSAAAPMVTGATALILSANPNLSWRDVKHILAVTADKVDATSAAPVHPQASANLAGHTYEQPWITNAGGMSFHNWYGFGRINVDAAVTMAKTYVSQLGTFKETNTGATWKYDSGNLNNLPVPGGNATGVSQTLTVTETFKIEAIQVRLSAAQCVGALGVELTSPSGTKSILMNINSQIIDSSIDSHIFLTNAFYNEDSAGVWTLKLVNARANCTSQWRNWQINVMGH